MYPRLGNSVLERQHRHFRPSFSIIPSSSARWYTLQLD